MKIEVGKFYKTRDGQKVKIVDYHPGLPNPFVAEASGLTLILSNRGRIDPRRITDFDIVAEWTDPLPAKATCGTGAFEIERHRQKIVEGYLPADEDWAEGELIQAAMCYAQRAQGQVLNPGLDRRPVAPNEWPWDIEWWKPDPDPQRNLERAGALLAVEWDRLERLKGGPEA